MVGRRRWEGGHGEFELGGGSLFARRVDWIGVVVVGVVVEVDDGSEGWCWRERRPLGLSRQGV